MADSLQQSRDNVLWQASLSLLRRKRILNKTKKYELQLIFCRLVRRETQLMLLCYKGQQVGCTPLLSYKIRNYTTRFGLPDNAVRLCDSNASIICLQTPDDVIFLTFESEEKRAELINCIEREIDDTGRMTDVYQNVRIYDEPHPSRFRGANLPPVPRMKGRNEYVTNSSAPLCSSNGNQGLSGHYPVPGRPSRPWLSAPAQSSQRARRLKTDEEMDDDSPSTTNQERDLNHEYFRFGGVNRRPGKSYSMGDLGMFEKLEPEFYDEPVPGNDERDMTAPNNGLREDAGYYDPTQGHPQEEIRRNPQETFVEKGTAMEPLECETTTSLTDSYLSSVHNLPLTLATPSLPGGLSLGSHSMNEYIETSSKKMELKSV